MSARRPADLPDRAGSVSTRLGLQISRTAPLHGCTGTDGHCPSTVPRKVASPVYCCSPMMDRASTKERSRLIPSSTRRAVPPAVRIERRSTGADLMTSWLSHIQSGAAAAADSEHSAALSARRHQTRLAAHYRKHGDRRRPRGIL